MKSILKKGILFLLVLSVALAATGCNSKAKQETAEQLVHTYLTALKGLNLPVMESCLSGGTNADFGIRVKEAAEKHKESEAYKKAVNSMFQSLSNTLEIRVDSSEKLEDDKIAVRATLSYVDVDQATANAFLQEKLAIFIEKYPKYHTLSETEQSDLSISVMAEAYSLLLNRQEKTTSTVDIVVAPQQDGQLKIINGSENDALKQLLTKLFSTY